MGIMRIMKTDGTHYDEECADSYQGEKGAMRTRLQEIVGGDLELVKVLYKGRPTAMFVNDRGATIEGFLPVNRPASEIYHTAWATREGRSLCEVYDELPKIHGNVALLFECTVT